MAEEREDIELVIEPDEKKPEGDIKVVKAEETAAETVPAARVVTADEGIDTLKQRLATTEADRERERQGRLQAEQRAHAANVEVQDTNLALVTNAISERQAKGENLKARYRAAREAGDFDAEAEALEQMQENQAELLQLKQGKAAMEAAPKAEPPKPRASSDAAEDLAAQMSPKSAAWIRAHPEFARDPVKFQAMLAAHNLAVARDGLVVDSDDYFSAIEDTLRISTREPVVETETTSGAAPATKRRESPPPAAPPGGGGSGNGVNRPNVVRLTAAEREIAELNGMTDQEYAKHKLALQKENRLTTQH